MVREFAFRLTLTDEQNADIEHIINLVKSADVDHELDSITIPCCDLDNDTLPDKYSISIICKHRESFEFHERINDIRADMPTAIPMFENLDRSYEIPAGIVIYKSNY